MRYLIINFHNNWTDVDDGICFVNSKPEAELAVMKLVELGIDAAFVERELQ